MDEKTFNELNNFAIDIREKILHQLAVRGFGHIGGSMSVADIVAVLYGCDMNIDPSDPNKPDRDMLVCSKGHAGPALYAALALKGFMPLDELDTLNVPGTNLPSHCDRTKTPGIDMTTGSLGQGLSAACGMALASRLDNDSRTVFCIIGDGESQEGQVWEAALFAAQQKLSNLVLFIDYNKVQLDGYTKDINDLGDLAAKFDAFGWHTADIDGHDIKAIHEAIADARKQSDRPSVIIANTVKGKGASFTKPDSCHHLKNITKELCDEAVAELEKHRMVV